jgi:hypothetical protein
MSYVSVIGRLHCTVLYCTVLYTTLHLALLDLLVSSRLNFRVENMVLMSSDNTGITPI